LSTTEMTDAVLAQLARQKDRSPVQEEAHA